MRRVFNLTNRAALATYSELFINPLLRALLSAKEDSCSVTSCRQLLKLPKRARKVLEASFAIQIKRGETFAQICDALVKSTTLQHLHVSMKLYVAQSLELASGNYSIPQKSVDPAIRKFFTHVIYAKLFDSEVIWRRLGRKCLTRKQFHDNFRTDNNHPSSCPYCDLDTINSPGTHVVEHFLPKSKFPLLAVDPWNLFTACHGCNMPSGKGARVVKNVTTPYVVEVGVNVQFKFLGSAKTLDLTAPKGRKDIDGYLRLVSLSARYADVNTWHQFDGRCQAFVESISGRDIADLSKLLDYVNTIQRGATLSYALAAWVRDVYHPAQVAALAPGV